MSYAIQENSTEAGSPVELYEFTIGATNYYFATGAESVINGGHTYVPLAISRDTIVIGPENRTEVVQISMPEDHPFVTGYATVVPGNRAFMVLKRFHRTDGMTETITVFQGVVRAVSFSDKGGFARVGVMPISGALTRQVPRYVYSSQCNHVLFDSWCTKDENDYKYTGAVTAASGQFLTVTGSDLNGNGWFTAGFAKFNGDYRMIIKSHDTTIKLLLPFNENLIGSNVDLYAGCDHSAAVCKSAKFNNLINFGGFPNVPTQNPFNTGL